MNNLNSIQQYINKFRDHTGPFLRPRNCPFETGTHYKDRWCSWCDFLFPGREATGLKTLKGRVCPCYSKKYGFEEIVRVMREFFPEEGE